MLTATLFSDENARCSSCAARDTRRSSHLWNWCHRGGMGFLVFLSGLPSRSWSSRSSALSVVRELLFGSDDTGFSFALSLSGVRFR